MTIVSARTDLLSDRLEGRDAESQRLAEDRIRTANWKRWGPYLSERQWGTVREDYSAEGSAWEYFPHDHARSRAYRWGEDGLMGICDRECRLCFAPALWNGRDRILKERLFGLGGWEGNHGEDCKECYFYLDSTPSHSYMKALYKYPQSAFPYAQLIEENRRRDQAAPEFELLETGVFDEGRYFDVFVEYAKASPDDMLIRITAANRGAEAAVLHLLPTLWFRNTWSWGCAHEGCWPKPLIERGADGTLVTSHVTLGRFCLAAQALTDLTRPEFLFTENETNAVRLFHDASVSGYTKDAFHHYVVDGRLDAVNPRGCGTKAAAHYHLTIPAGDQLTVRLRLFADGERAPSPLAHPSTRFSRIESAKPMNSIRPASPDGCRSGSSTSLARPTLDFSGRSSSTITSSRTGWEEIRRSQRRPRRARRAETMTGSISITAT